MFLRFIYLLLVRYYHQRHKMGSRISPPVHSSHEIFPAERAECREAIAEKFESLRLFSLRWRIAGEYTPPPLLSLFSTTPYGMLTTGLRPSPNIEEMVRQLEEKRGIHRSEYINNLPSPTVSAPPSYSMMDVSN